MEVGYFERFLRVLVADTTYIAVVDEDTGALRILVLLV